MAALQQLVDALAERLGRPVALEDRRYRVLAYSAHAEPPDRVRLTSILTREAPADVVAWLDERGLGRADGPVRLPDAPHLGMGPRVAVPVRGDRVLGFLWLIDEGLREEELAAAEQAAAAAVPLLVRLRESERSDHALVGALLGDDADARRRAAQALRECGLRGPLRVLTGPGVPSAPHRGLVPGPGAALLTGGEEALAGAEGAIGVSGERARLEDARDALPEAQTALLLGPALGSAVAWWDRLGAYQLLAPLAGTPVPAPLRRLLDHPDAEPLVATLEAYLDRAGDARAAADALFVHRTSLYHRLRRIERIAGVDLRDGDDRLLLHMGLRIRRLHR